MTKLGNKGKVPLWPTLCRKTQTGISKEVRSKKPWQQLEHGLRKASRNKDQLVVPPKMAIVANKRAPLPTKSGAYSNST